ncbi:fused MFS/spermidine synthase [Sphingomonas sp. CFBP8993]|uniref:fused MFS/spermidine synthase n=1 Tax=Sphingomonas sp. CFBP8993 TaxID=3096526 RepID=UPI002A6B3F0F|nr:fused MFS/spermidine synthase [Sphingomonas sp. CFBP8993]MDY0958800.1 fused MFS/spermidine synthase [Sphingomonas sp. CFBP8993]
MTGRIPKLAARALFVVTILTGSFLLFLVQPLVARMALPRLGGAPAVWNSAMFVYQALLLGGYAYAHALGRFRPRVQAGVHLGLLGVAALWLPIGLMAVDLPADAEPALWVPWLLGLSIGPLFFAVSAQAPLIQRWFALAHPGRNPYALYAASNLGSFAGLIAYPLLVEPAMTLHGQSLLWSIGYGVLALLVLVCATWLPGSAKGEAAVATSSPPGWRRIALWTALAAVPSGLVLATSTYITTDIVAMPLLWVLPLGLYLASFIVAFATRRAAADTLTRIAPVTLLLFGGVIMGGYPERPYSNVAVALLLLFMVSVALHTALYRARPGVDRLTGFYLWMAVGGALGGVFAGILAPVLFDWTYEYPILILAAGALIPQQFLLATIRDLWWRHGRRMLAAMALAIGGLIALRMLGPASLFGEERQGIAFLVIAMLGFLVIGARWGYVLLLAGALALFGGYRALSLSMEHDARMRSYFGVYTIRDGAGYRELDHGSTVHGIQLRGAPARERTPTTYYAPLSGVGRAMRAAPSLYGPAARIGVVGLGTGTLACYARPGQQWRFYEIDPVIVRIARDTGQFSYLRLCQPDPLIRIGDARVRLSAEASAGFDLLALDAFSSDAVPAHLLTREAFATYARVLSRRGLLLIHISNRFVDLEPLVAAAARDGDWTIAKLNYVPTDLDREEQATSSVWLALSRDPAVLKALEAAGGDWTPAVAPPGLAAWTDDYSSVLPFIREF